MARLETFTAWFKDNGGALHSDVEFAWSYNNGFHLRVKIESQVKGSSIGKNTTIISCPHSLSLSALNALPSPPLQPSAIDNGETKKQKPSEESLLPQELLRNARPQCVAAFGLCTQYLLFDRSPWYGYIAILPRPPPYGQDGAVDELSEEGVEATPIIDTAMWWTKDERLAIAGTNLARGIEDLESVWKKEWETWSPLLLDWAAKKDLAGLDWRLFKWAVSIYGSRAFSSAVLSFATDSQTGKRLLEVVDPHALLYPGVDMLNHSNETKNGWSCNEKGFALVCNDEPRPGEEIFNSYGMKDNGSLLLSFGFALADNPRDAFALKLPRTKPPALLEALQASKSRPEDDEYKSTASALRFASSIDAKKDPDIPTSPGQTILINEAETPLSHDPDHSIFYVRLARTLVELSMLQNKRLNPGYPQLLTGPPYDDHLCGFPSALLEVLAAHLANEREAKQATAALSKGSTERLWRLLGERNQMALTILLFGKLRMEAVKLLNLGLVTEKTVDLPKTGLGTTATISDRRHQHAVTYVQDQLEIVLDNILALRWKILTSFAGLDTLNDLAGKVVNTIFRLLRDEVSVPPATADKRQATPKKEEKYRLDLLHELTKQKPAAPQLFTIDRAMSVMMKLEPNIALDFMAGILTLTGRDPHLVTGEHAFYRGIEHLRRSGSAATEEEVFVLWVITMYILRYELGDHVSWHIDASPLFMGICDFWRRSYGLTASLRERIEGEADNEEGKSTEKPVLLRDAALLLDLGAIRRALPESDLWSSKVWDRAEEFVAVAERIVKEETVSVMLSEDEYTVLNETFEVLNEAALANAYPQVDVETEDVVRVVALYLPADK